MFIILWTNLIPLFKKHTYAFEHLCSDIKKHNLVFLIPKTVNTFTLKGKDGSKATNEDCHMV